MSSSVKRRLKQHTLKVFKINLTTITIHVWKHASLLAGFWIKQKFQDTSLHHTTLTPWVGHWMHYILLKEKITYSQGYVGGVEVKSPLHVQMRGIYSQEWDWPLWMFAYPHDCLTCMNFQLYITLHTTSGSLGLPCYITLIENMAHNRYVANMTHDKTQHDSVGTFMLMLVCMSSCSVAGWWMSSWCVIASPPHGKVHRVFDGHWFAWCCIHALLFACMLVSLTGLSIHKKCIFVCPSVCEHIFHVFSFICSWTHLCMIVHLQAHLRTEHEIPYHHLCSIRPITHQFAKVVRLILGMTLPPVPESAK